MRLNATYLVGLVVTLILVAILLPIGLVELTNDANWIVDTATNKTLFETLDKGSTLKTLVYTLIPILVIVGIALNFIPRVRNR